MSKIVKASDYIADFISQTGVQHVFTVSGAGNLHILDSIGARSDLELVCNHHEQASAMCMESYSRSGGKFGISLVTFGPGSTNAITGLAGAWMDSVPCMVISGQSKLSDTIQGRALRQRGVQEIDIISIVKPISKYAVMIKDAKDIPYHFQKAYYLSKLGRPGPVWIDIPMDLQAVKINIDECRKFDPIAEGFKFEKSMDVDLLKNIADEISKAKRPILLLGHGIRLSGAIKEMEQLISELSIPVLSTWNGADLISSDDPHYVGRPGTYGQRGANFAMQNCDLLISIGARLSIPQTGYSMAEFCRAAKKIMVDIDQAELEKFESPFEYVVCADAKAFIKQLLEVMRGCKIGATDEWRSQCLKWRDTLPSCEPQYYKTEGAINSYVFVEELAKVLQHDDAVITDMGTSFTCVHQTLKLKKGQRFYTSSGLASMGFGIPGAVGSCLGRDLARTICLVGDGAFQMNVQELDVIHRLNLPIKIFVLNNNGYLTIKHTQRALFKGRLVASNPDSGVSCACSVAIANAYGLPAVSVSSLAGLEKILSNEINKPGPMLIEVMMPEDQLLVPKSSIEIKPDGQIVSRPLEDLYPFIDRQIFSENMLVDILPASKE